ncbi:MAG: AGE family epimerase/isomerase [Petrimonas sp.]|jgi:mannobiose 2-epimerase|nr:AGE family epimerase/isomerase [Petrimonas sp.]
MQNELQPFRREIEKELVENILPYWATKMPDKKNGGFYGQITGEEGIIHEAHKGAVLNSRILWTFSAAYRIYRNPGYLTLATRAKNYIIDKFFDKEFGGVYWLLDYKGKPVEPKKQIYAQGFAIYGLSEYYRATDDSEALLQAINLYRLIEKYSFDAKNNGYREAFTRDWHPIEDMRLSEKDVNEQKTTNTHLHILEPYANLYRVWKDNGLKEKLKNLIDLFLDKILNDSTHHLNLFFDADWNNKGNSVSFGHDIEASWLLHEAALVLDDEETLEKVRKTVPLVVNAAVQGLLPDGSMMYEANTLTGSRDTERHWWVQAETVVGLLNHYQHYNDEKSLDKALSCWNYIKSKLIDHENGEWFWSICPDGSVNRKEDKAGIWKCPYHNGRMCLEVIERFCFS